MAFRNAAGSTGDANIDITLITCPNNYEIVVHALYLANISTTPGQSVTVSVKIVRNASEGASFHILFNTTVLWGNTLVFDKPINLRQADQILVQSNTAVGIEAVASLLVVPADDVPPVNFF